MMEAHQEMQRLVQEKDPLLSFARQICRDTRLLCLDELHIDNIADAMILGRLFTALFDGGVILMTTSNYPPDGLYPNGLQRQNFLPTIDLLKRELTVLNVDNGSDYRMRDGLRAPLYLMPDDAASEQHIAVMFEELSAGSTLPQTEITILGRSIPVKKCATQAAWFDFAELCGRPHGQNDYLAIAEHYPTVFISHIPQMSAEQSAPARRLTWLVDVFYDCRVKLVISAACAPQILYTDGIAAGEFARTVSRLIEMQTQAYLDLPHRG
jgi:cell division protein ZapE